MQNMTSGVYKITNNITGELYIGSSKDIKLRWVKHKCYSFWKKQPNSKLYKDMASYGLDNFTFEIIEETDNLREREQYYIEQLKPSYNNYRAKGRDTERRKEAHKRSNKEWHKSHRNEMLAYGKAYSKAYYSRLCFYEGKTLTLTALAHRFRRQGIPHPTLEAKKHLL